MFRFLCLSWIHKLQNLLRHHRHYFLLFLLNAVEYSSRPFYDFQKRQFTFSKWLTILIATVHNSLKAIILGCWVIATGRKLQKGLELDLSLHNQTKKDLEMFIVSCTNILPRFILILNRIQEKQWKMYYLICSYVDDDVTNYEVCGFMENTKI